MIFASFQAKKGQKSPRKSENVNYRFDQFLPEQLQEIRKKYQKKFKKLKNLIFASFQTKKGREGLRKTENKNYRSDPLLPDQL